LQKQISKDLAFFDSYLELKKEKEDDDVLAPFIETGRVHEEQLMYKISDPCVNATVRAVKTEMVKLGYTLTEDDNDKIITTVPKSLKYLVNKRSLESFRSLGWYSDKT